MKTNSFNARISERRAVVKEAYFFDTDLVEPDYDYDPPKYGVLIAFPVEDEQTYSAIDDAMRAAFEQKRKKLSRNGETISFEDVIKPVREDEDFDDFYFLRAMTTEKPGMVDAKADNLELEDEPVEGSKGRISVLFKCARIKDKVRVYAVLEHVQILSNKNHFESLNSSATAKDVFGQYQEKED